MSQDLARWASALEKWGIAADVRNGVLYEDEPFEWRGDYLEVKSGTDGWAFTPLPTDGQMAFLWTVARRCFGEWAYFAPEDIDEDGFEDSWALCYNDGDVARVRGSGPTIPDALLDALELGSPKEAE